LVLPVLPFTTTRIQSCLLTPLVARKILFYAVSFVNHFTQHIAKLTNSKKVWGCSICYTINYFPEGIDIQSDLPRTPFYELFAPEEFIYKILQVPTYLFVIDLSNPEIHQTLNILETLKKTLKAQREEETFAAGAKRAKIGFISFHKFVDVYLVHNDSIKMATQTETETSAQTLFDDNLLFEFYSEKSEEIIEKILVNISEQLKNLKQCSECCFEYAAELAMKSLEHHGGKVILVQTNVPSEKSQRKEEKPSLVSKLSVLNIFKSKKSPEDEILEKEIAKSKSEKERLSKFLQTLSLRALRHEITFSIFLLTLTRDLKTIPAKVPQLLQLVKFGGKFFNYTKQPPVFKPDVFSISNEFSHDLDRETSLSCAWQAMMKIRLPSPFVLKALHGSLHLSEDYISFGVIDEDYTVSAEFGPIKNGDMLKSEEKKLSDRLKTAEEFFSDIKDLETNLSVQFSVLFTDQEGVRKIRVFNTTLPRTGDNRSLYDGIQLKDYFALVAKRAAALHSSSGPRESRDYLQMSNSLFLWGFNKYANSQIKFNSLDDYPESFRYLPKYTIAALKSFAFDDLNEKNENRAFWSYQIRNCSNNEVIYALYPSLYDLKNFKNIEMEEKELLEKQISLCIKNVKPSTVYVLRSFKKLIFRIGAEETGVFEELSGIKKSDFEKMDEKEIAKILVEKLNGNDFEEDSLGQRINRLWCNEDDRCNSLTVCIEGRESDEIFKNLMREDRTQTVMGIDDYVVSLASRSFN